MNATKRESNIGNTLKKLTNMHRNPVKTFTACKSRSGHNNSKTAPVDRRARMVVSSYGKKFKTLDMKFAADVVGDGKRDIKDPFETAQQ